MVMVLTQQGAMQLGEALATGAAPMARYDVRFPYMPMELAMLRARPYLAGTPHVRLGLNPRIRGGLGGRIVRRIVRYTALGAGMWFAGFGAGYFLSMAKALAVTAVTSVVGGAVATRMIAQDLSKVSFLSGFGLTRIAAAAYGGGLFGLLPFAGAGTGLLYWFGRSPEALKYRSYFHDRIRRAGRRGLTGWGN